MQGVDAILAGQVKGGYTQLEAEAAGGVPVSQILQAPARALLC